MPLAFRDALATKDFVVTAEVGPPKGTDIQALTGHIDLLAGQVDGLNVTDNQSSVMRVGSLAICRLIQERGGEPILQLTCRDRNRLALQSELLSASVLGVHNVLCLTGDHLSIGDHPQARAVFDLDSVQLLQAVEGLNRGVDLAGNPLAGATDLFPGAAATPDADPLEPQLLKFEKKVAAGARFIQTQAVYDPAGFGRFMDRARELPVKVLAGIVLLASARMARYMNQHVPGIRVPAELVAELEAAGKGEGVEVGVRIAGRLIRTLREERLCDGVHVMAIGREERVPEILAAAGLEAQVQG